ncbi:uncharacterized protein LOC111241944 [Vigna radiata var. radiata]|uniref:Uncharacterized protein LOC111241944 n=1 Tax=Vigna radiata var. radiata TaxID=3916 RepID=A0A3Q0F317_VIGRR|nr:uncharacterized protein LOC111241944 [Vigna radiata var. radiata]
MDVKSVFLNRYIKEEFYMEQPPDFQDYKHPDHVFKLRKALYGLKQTPRSWYERLSEFLGKKGFNRGKVDSTLFIKNSKNDRLYVQIYIDDIIFGSTNYALCKEFSKTMQEEFEISMMGELTYFLGLQVKQSENGIFIHQSKYCNDLLKKYKMLDCKEAETPMATNCYLDLDENDNVVDQKLYRGMTEPLLYLTASRPDIMHNVCLCARFQSQPKESHLTIVKRILKYLKGTKSLGLWYPSGINIFLEGYSDSDFGGCKLDKNSINGTCHLLGCSLVS